MPETATTTSPKSVKPEEAKEIKAPIYKLKQSRLEMGESRMRWWFAVPEEGTPYEALFEPTYWDVHAYKFATGDFIRVEPDEGHYTADLKVTAAGVGGVKVAEYYKKDWKRGEAPAGIANLYQVKWAGPHHKWRVERIADHHIEQAGFNNENEANQWLAANLKNLTKAH